MSLRIKRRCMDFLVICGIFFCLYGLSMTVLSDIYVLNWTAQNRYVYLWIPILLLVIFEQRLLSYILTVGNIIGIVIGQILGDYLMDYHHPGVFIWIEVVFFSLIIGILAKVIICWHRKRHSSAWATCMYSMIQYALITKQHFIYTWHRPIEMWSSNLIPNSGPASPKGCPHLCPSRQRRPCY